MVHLKKIVEKKHSQIQNELLIISVQNFLK